MKNKYQLLLLPFFIFSLEGVNAVYGQKLYPAASLAG